MSGPSVTALLAFDDAVDGFVRRAWTRVAERRGAHTRRSDRREQGVALRRRGQDGEILLEAWSEELDGEGLDEPQDPAPLAAAAVGMDLVVVQCTTVATSHEDREGRRANEPRPLALVTLAVRSRLGLLGLTRLASALTPEHVAACASHLATARSLAEADLVAVPPVALVLEAEVAAAVLAALWAAERPQAGNLDRAISMVTAPGVVLADDARPAGGPLGARFDGEGRETRRVVLAGDGASTGARELGRWRASFADPPRPAPANLLLRAPAWDGSGPACFHARALVSADPRPSGGARLGLLGHDAAGQAARAELDLDLAALLAAVVGEEGDVVWTAGAGAVGSKRLHLVLGGRGAPASP